MAKHGKAPPARRTPERFDDSALLRSAEALGRMIGALQRQLDGATKKLRSTPARAAADAALHRHNGRGDVVAKRRQTAAAGTSASRRDTKPRTATARPAKAKPTNARSKRASRPS